MPPERWLKVGGWELDLSTYELTWTREGIAFTRWTKASCPTSNERSGFTRPSADR